MGALATIIDIYPWSVRVAAVFEFEDAQIVCERAYWDRRTIDEQLQ